MINKKGQEMSVTTLILIVLGVIVLVILVLGFSIGWDTIFGKLKFAPGDVQALQKACIMYAEQDFNIDYCQFRKIKTDSGTEYMNCEDKRVKPSGAQIDCTKLSGDYTRDKYCEYLKKSKEKDISKIYVNGELCLS
ncbi:MAG: hypothetical protein N3D20_01405 [Candidatus Pacearchaeota archaeon]|nr:hypothetical protein [Candidatus Pacearchaeota archaeon]